MIQDSTCFKFVIDEKVGREEMRGGKYRENKRKSRGENKGGKEGKKEGIVESYVSNFIKEFNLIIYNGSALRA